VNSKCDHGESHAAGGLAPHLVDLDQPRHSQLEAIRLACASSGLFQMVNHGLPKDLMERAVAEAHTYFSAPLERKLQGLRSSVRPWGFYDRELTKNRRDEKQIFDIGPDIVGLVGQEGSTPLPSWQPGFTVAMRQYFQECLNLARRVVSLLAHAICADSPQLLGNFDPSHSSFLRLNYYPSTRPGNEACLGIHEHTDAGALTILHQFGPDALQILVGDKWHTITPRSDALLVNLGDLARVWSNEQFVAPVHRVLTHTDGDRLSLAFFFNPDYETMVSPLDVCVHGQPKFRPFRWRDYRQQRALGDYADYGREIQIEDFKFDA
jgi:isopenicillin N synthase-like dioxygenase